MATLLLIGLFVAVGLVFLRLLLIAFVVDRLVSAVLRSKPLPKESLTCLSLPL